MPRCFAIATIKLQMKQSIISAAYGVAQVIRVGEGTAVCSGKDIARQQRGAIGSRMGRDASHQQAKTASKVDSSHGNSQTTGIILLQKRLYVAAGDCQSQTATDNHGVHANHLAVEADERPT